MTIYKSCEINKQKLLIVVTHLTLWGSLAHTHGAPRPEVHSWNLFPPSAQKIFLCACMYTSCPHAGIGPPQSKKKVWIRPCSFTLLQLEQERSTIKQRAELYVASGKVNKRVFNCRCLSLNAIVMFQKRGSRSSVICSRRHLYPC